MNDGEKEIFLLLSKNISISILRDNFYFLSDWEIGVVTLLSIIQTMGPQFVLFMQIITFSTYKTKLTSDGKENSLHTFKPVTLYYGLLWHDV